MLGNFPFSLLLDLLFRNIYFLYSNGLGKFDAIQHGIDTGSNCPVKHRIRRTHLGFAGEEEAQLKKMFLVMNAVLERSSGLIFTCQYAELAFSLEYHTFLAKVSRHSSTKGKGNTSFVVRAFKAR
jgi:hypothetical protein